MVCIVDALPPSPPPAPGAPAVHGEGTSRVPVPRDTAASRSVTLPCSYLLPPRHVRPHVPAATQAPPGDTDAGAAAVPMGFGPDLARCHVLQPARARSSPLRTGIGIASERGGVGGGKRRGVVLRSDVPLLAAARRAPGLHRRHRGPVSPHPTPDAGFLSPYASFPHSSFFFFYLFKKKKETVPK